MLCAHRPRGRVITSQKAKHLTQAKWPPQRKRTSISSCWANPSWQIGLQTRETYRKFCSFLHQVMPTLQRGWRFHRRNQFSLKTESGTSKKTYRQSHTQSTPAPENNRFASGNPRVRNYWITQVQGFFFLKQIKHYYTKFLNVKNLIYEAAVIPLLHAFIYFSELQHLLKRPLWGWTAVHLFPQIPFEPCVVKLPVKNTLRSAMGNLRESTARENTFHLTWHSVWSCSTLCWSRGMGQTDVSGPSSSFSDEKQKQKEMLKKNTTFAIIAGWKKHREREKQNCFR